MKKIRVPRCRINENLFIIDFTPTEDAADNRFGLNSEKTVTLLAIAFQYLLVVTCRNCRRCQKIFVAHRCYKMKKYMSLGVAPMKIYSLLIPQQKKTLPTTDLALPTDNHSFFLTFDPKVILAPPGASCENKPELSAPGHFGTGIFYIWAISMMDSTIL